VAENFSHNQKPLNDSDSSWRLELFKSLGVVVYGVVVVVSFIWRLVAVPWDGGGAFFHGWVSVVGLVLFFVLDSKAQTPAWRAARYVLLPPACVLAPATIYFAPQVILPFMLICFVFCAVWSSSGDAKLKGVYTAFLLIPLGVVSIYSISYLIPIYQLRNLDAQQVLSFEFVPLSPADSQSAVVRITSQDGIKAVVNALRKTTPYSPNHESIKEHWLARVRLKSGKKLEFYVGKGTGANPETAQIRIGVTVYQNPQLYQTLQTVISPPLWPQNRNN
jgi:hypothetical protein